MVPEFFGITIKKIETSTPNLSNVCILLSSSLSNHFLTTTTLDVLLPVNPSLSVTVNSNK
jgi:hypothetical protein